MPVAVPDQVIACVSLNEAAEPNVFTLKVLPVKSVLFGNTVDAMVGVETASLKAAE